MGISRIALPAAGIVLFVATVALAVSFHGAGSAQNKNTTISLLAISNLNTSAIETIFGSAALGGMSSSNPIQMQNGSSYVAVSSFYFRFNSSQSNSTALPEGMVSVLYLMRNKSDAVSAFKNMFYSGNANQSMTNYSYSHGNTTITVYEIHSVAVLNASILNATNLKKYGPPASPDFQYETLFMHGNIIGSVTTDSTSPALNSSYSAALTDYLIVRLINSKLV